MGSSEVDPDNCDGADLPSFEDEAGEEDRLLPEMAKAGKMVGHACLLGDAVVPPEVSRSQSDLLVSQFLAKMKPTQSGGRRNNSHTAADCRRSNAQHVKGKASSSSRVSLAQSDRPKQAPGKRATGAAANRRTKNISRSSRGSTSSHIFSLSPAEPPPPSYNKFVMLPKCIAFVSSSSTSRRDDPRRLIGNYGEAYSVSQEHLLSCGRRRDWGSNLPVVSIFGRAYSRLKDSDNLDPAFENYGNRRGKTKFENGSQQSTSTRRSEGNDGEPKAEVKSAMSWVVENPPASYVKAGVKREEHQATCFQERPLGRVASSTGPNAADPSVRQLPNLPWRSQKTASGAYQAGDHLSHPPLVSSSSGSPVNAAGRASEEVQQNVPPPQTKNKTVEKFSASEKNSGTVGLQSKEIMHQNGHNQARNCSRKNLRSDIAQSNKSGVVATTAACDDTGEQSCHPQPSSLSCASDTEVPKGKQARHKGPHSKQQQQKVMNCEPASHAQLSNSHAIDDETTEKLLPSLSLKQGGTEPSTVDASVDGDSDRKDRACLQTMSSTYDLSVIKALITERVNRENTLPRQQQEKSKIASHQSNSKPKSSSPGEQTVGLSPKTTPAPGLSCKGGTSCEPSSSTPAIAAAAHYSTETLIDRSSDGEERESWENTPERHVHPVKERQAVGDNKPKSDTKAEGGKCDHPSKLSPILRHDSVDWTTYDRHRASPHPLPGESTHPVGNGRCSSSPRSIESRDNLWRSNAIYLEFQSANRKKIRNRIWNILDDNGGPMPLFTVSTELKNMPHLDVGMSLKKLFDEGYIDGVVRYSEAPGWTIYLAIEGRGHEPRSRLINHILRPGQSCSYYGPSPKVTGDVKGPHDEGSRVVRSPRETSVSSEDKRHRSHTERGRRFRTSDGDSRFASSPKRYSPRSTKRSRDLSYRRSNSRSNRRLSVDTNSSEGGKGRSRDEKSYRSSSRHRRGYRVSGNDSDKSIGRGSTCRVSSYRCSSRSRSRWSRSRSPESSSSSDRSRSRSPFSHKEGHTGCYSRRDSSESSSSSDSRRLPRKLENRKDRKKAAPRGGARSSSYESSVSSNSPRRKREVAPRGNRHASRRCNSSDRGKRDRSESLKGSGTEKTRAGKGKVGKSAVKKKKKFGKGASCGKSKGNDASVQNKCGNEKVGVGDDARPKRQSPSSAATAVEERCGDKIEGNDQRTKKSVVALGEYPRPEGQSPGSAVTGMEQKCVDNTEGKDENGDVNMGDDVRPEGQSPSSAPEAADEKGGDGNESGGQETKKSVGGSVEGKQLEPKSEEVNGGDEQKTKKIIVGSCDHAKPERQDSSTTTEPMSETKLGDGRHGIFPTKDVKALSTKTTTRRPDNEAGACNGSSSASSKKPEEGEVTGPTTTVESPKKKMKLSMKLSMKPFTIRKKSISSLFKHPE